MTSRSLTDRLGGLAFGGDHNPEQWDEAVWKEEDELMRRARGNLATVGVLSWSLMEPEDGRYDFAWLDAHLDRLHANGVAVDLATPTASPRGRHRVQGRPDRPGPGRARLAAGPAGLGRPVARPGAPHPGHHLSHGLAPPRCGDHRHPPPCLICSAARPASTSSTPPRARPSTPGTRTPPTSPSRCPWPLRRCSSVSPTRRRTPPEHADSPHSEGT